MILRSSPPSPFGRKVRIAAALTSLSSRVTVMPADTSDDADPLRGQNPLGKIPALILDDGAVLYDSRVIVEYFDHLAGGGVLIPTDPARRFATLTTQALGDGLIDAAILIIYETRWRDESVRSAKWTEHQQGKIDRALAAFAANPPAGAVDIGHIATACALGYLDLRHGGLWRAGYPGLVTWLDHFAAAVPAFEATRFVQPA